MKKAGRSGLPYPTFVETWQQLLAEGRAGNNAAHQLLGGSKSTIAAYRKQYETESAAKAMAVLDEIELAEAVKKSIAAIKIKAINLLEESNAQLQSQIDDHIGTLKETEVDMQTAQSTLEVTRQRFADEKLAFERQLAVAQARCDDLNNEARLAQKRYHDLQDRCNAAEQAAAVAKKEVAMLREQQVSTGSRATVHNKTTKIA